MKKIKKLLAGVIACALIACSCGLFVGCDNGEETPPATEPVATIHNAQYAQNAYNQALANTLMQTARKNIVTLYEAEHGLLVKEYEGTQILKNNIYCISDTEWVKDGNLYDEETRTYKVLGNFANNVLIDATMSMVQEFESCSSVKKFISATELNGEITVGMEVEAGNLYKATITIKNNLITKIDTIGFWGDDGSLSGSMQMIIVYDNVEFPRTMPADFDSYTKSGGLDPLE